jgi:hypothetical protein
VSLRKERERGDAPLSDYDAAFPSLDAGPHAAAIFKILCSRVDRVQSRRFGLAPVRNETPFHGVHHECRSVRLCAANDGRMGPRGDVVAGDVAVSVYPLFDTKCRVTIELLDLVGLVREYIHSMVRESGRAHLQC